MSHNERRKRKKTDKSSVVRQLNESGLSPMRERIGIYIIAGLSIIGIMLIVYTGVMAAAHSVAAGSGSADGMGVDEITQIIDDLDLDNGENDDEEYVDEENGDDIEPEEDDEEPDDEEEDEGVPAILNENNVELRGRPDGSRVLDTFSRGTEIIVLDMETNPFWTRVIIDGEEGYIESNRFDLVD